MSIANYIYTFLSLLYYFIISQFLDFFDNMNMWLDFNDYSLENTTILEYTHYILINILVLSLLIIEHIKHLYYKV
jgi:hypothetical protein